MAQLRGMTWSHRRAVAPLLATLPAFRERRPDVEITWHERPLSGFEFQSVYELSETFDLIILDHPFTGDIASGRYLLPLDSLLAGRDKEFVGPSLETYRYGGSIWALPVDAACQVAVSRPDRLGSFAATAPTTWNAVLALGEAVRRKGLSLAIGLKGVHSLMTFFTLMASSSHPCSVEREGSFFDRAAAVKALAAIRALVKFCPAEVFEWNSIELHDVMVARDDLVYCPAVYCYATYAERDQRRPLRFHQLPGLDGPSPAGSTIGGTGLGISARCAEPEAALAYAQYLLEPATQLAFAANNGQPARVEAWEDTVIDERFGGCFAATRSTIEAAWTRPRYSGYLAFQEQAGPLVQQHLRGGLEEAALLRTLEELRANATS